MATFPGITPAIKGAVVDSHIPLDPTHTLRQRCQRGFGGYKTQRQGRPKAMETVAAPFARLITCT